MPLYEYACDKCGHREDNVASIADREKPWPCPKCGIVPKHGPRCFKAALRPLGTMRRDAVASMKPHTDTGYQSPILSNSAGINPDQIPEALAKFPHHEYTPDGRMIFRSHQARERALKDIGMIDLK